MCFDRQLDGGNVLYHLSMRTKPECTEHFSFSRSAEQLLMDINALGCCHATIQKRHLKQFATKLYTWNFKPLVLWALNNMLRSQSCQEHTISRPSNWKYWENLDSIYRPNPVSYRITRPASWKSMSPNIICDPSVDWKFLSRAVVFLF